MLRIILLAGILAFIAYPLQAEEKAAKNENTEMHGIWNVVESESKGEKIDLPWMWIFKPDGKANLVDRKAGKQSLFRCKIDVSTAPHRLELVYLGPDAALKSYRQLGIWKLEAEKLTMHLSLPNAEAYPTDFKSPKKEEFLLVLEKVTVE